MKRLIYALYYRFGKLIGFHKHFNKMNESSTSEISYKIGNVKHHNTTIDGLMPQLVEIGDNFISAPGSVILSHDASPYIHIRKHRVEKTIVGNEVFLGLNSIVMPGVKIGNRVIVGAGAIVTKDVPDGVVVVGNPAKVLCSVDEYMGKLEEKEVLFETPESFEDLFLGKKLNQEHLNEFQKKYLDDMSS